MAIDKNEGQNDEFAIHVVEVGAQPRMCYRPCYIGQNIIFDQAALETYNFSNWSPLISDLMLLAGAVEFCDRARKRPKGGWSRNFKLRVPVGDTATWNSTPVKEALIGALAKVTGDRWAFEFVQAAAEPRRPTQPGLYLPDRSAIVVPFSDGMDSRCASGILQAEGENVLHVRLGPKKIDRPKRGGRKLPFAAVPYRVPGKFPETSCRSRGFRFALIAGIAAFLSGASRIAVPESAQGALGPVLVPVMHGQPDYRNHPAFTVKMERFIRAVLGCEIRYEFPRLWFTKGQTLRQYVDLTGSEEWLGTKTCWQKRRMSVDGKARQCGMCAACLLRRQSVHAAGLVEPEAKYMWDDLGADHFKDGAASGFKHFGTQHRYADAAIVHLDHLAAFQSSPLSAETLRRQVAELSAALGKPQIEIELKLREVLLQHHREWQEFRQSLGIKSFIARRSAFAA